MTLEEHMAAARKRKGLPPSDLGDDIPFDDVEGNAQEYKRQVRSADGTIRYVTVVPWERFGYDQLTGRMDPRK